MSDATDRLRKQLAAAPPHQHYDVVASELVTRGFVLTDGVWRYEQARFSDDAIHNMLNLWDQDGSMAEEIIGMLPIGRGDAVTRLGDLTREGS